MLVTRHSNIIYKIKDIFLFIAEMIIQALEFKNKSQKMQLTKSLVPQHNSVKLSPSN